MIFVRHDNTDPYINHAIEEYIMDKFDDDCFMLWRNEPCILIGKNQNTLSEININYVTENKMPVVRRITGGGAIFNDHGNLNFTFISNKNENAVADFEKFTNPIIRALKKLSVDAELKGRNDLIINGRKFSGNAQCYYKDKILHHGSILFSCDMSSMVKALKVNNIKFQDKAIKSVESRVTNISDHLKNPMSVSEFKEFLFEFVMKEEADAELYELTAQEWDEIKKLSEDKYATWEWNYGHSPRFDFFNEKKFKGGIVQTAIAVENGIVENIRFHGDFFSVCDIKELEDDLTGVIYSEGDVKKSLSSIDVGKYMVNIDREDLLEVMFNGI